MAELDNNDGQPWNMWWIAAETWRAIHRPFMICNPTIKSMELSV